MRVRAKSARRRPPSLARNLQLEAKPVNAGFTPDALGQGSVLSQSSVTLSLAGTIVMFTPRSGRRSDRGEESEVTQGPQDEMVGQWMDGAGRSSSAATSSAGSPVGFRRRPVSPSLPRKRGTFGDLTALALHGDDKLRADDITFLQHFSTEFPRAVPVSKLDSVTFNFGDRVAAWLSGMGAQLRQLKEMQLDEPVQPDGQRTRQSTLTKVHRRSLVLVGGGESLAHKQRGLLHSGELSNLSGPALIHSMSSMMLRAHFEAIVFGKTNGKASARELRESFETLRQEHHLSWFDRLIIRFSEGFTDIEKLELLDRLPVPPDAVEAEGACAVEAAAMQSASAAPRQRLSVADLTSGNWVPEESGRHSTNTAADDHNDLLPQVRASQIRNSVSSYQSRTSFVTSRI